MQANANLPRQFTFRMTAGMTAGFEERYTEQFARSLIGKTPRLNIREFEGGPVLAEYGEWTVVEAELVDDGKAVLVTVEKPA